jgi:hypothetical protein
MGRRRSFADAAVENRSKSAWRVVGVEISPCMYDDAKVF